MEGLFVPGTELLSGNGAVDGFAGIAKDLLGGIWAKRDHFIFVKHGINDCQHL